MRRGRYILAIDLGTSAVKLALVSLAGEIGGWTVEPLPVRVMPDGGAEQDPEVWWEAVVAATHRVLTQSGIDPTDIVGAGCSSQWSGTVPIDAGGKTIMPAIIWMDSRGASHVRKVTAGFPSIQGYGAARLIAWIRRTGGAPGHSGKDPIAHILFIRDEHPAIYERTATFLEPRDWLNFRLTGRIASTFDAITLHWVANTRDVNAVHYDDRLLAMTGLDRSRLPELLPPATVLGPMTRRAAGELGLPESVQVVSGAPDIMAAAIGAGAIADFDAHLCIGTSSWLVCHVPRKRTDLLHNMASLPSAIPGRYLLANEQESAGVCLTVLKDRILFPEDQPESSSERFAEMLAMAEGVPAGSGGLLFTPWLNGERTPVDDRTIRGGFFNQSLDASRAHMVRAVLEGVAMNSRWLLRYVEKFIRRRLAAIPIVGGGARSELWCQIHADVLDRPIRQVADPTLANARGAALQACVALGHLSWDDVAGRVPIARAFEPDPSNRARYDELFPEFLAIYRRTRKIHARLNRAR